MSTHPNVKEFGKDVLWWTQEVAEGHVTIGR